MDNLPGDEVRDDLSLVCAASFFLPLIHHHRYSTMRGYQYPLTDTDVGQLAASDPKRFHLGCRVKQKRDATRRERNRNSTSKHIQIEKNRKINIFEKQN